MGGFSPAQALIAAMITPALLILASGSLIATALVRLSRVVDRIRKIAEGSFAGAQDELARLERRGLQSELAVERYFFAIVCFVVAGIAIAVDHASGDRFFWVPVVVTTAGMALIVAGSWEMLGECRLSTQQIRAEVAAARGAISSGAVPRSAR